MGAILFILSIILTIIFGVIGLIVSVLYYLITLKWVSGIKAINDMFLQIAISIDQTGNVLCKTLFNKTLIQLGGYSFGCRMHTVSYVLGKNKETNTLTKLGKALVWILNIIDKGHVEKSVKIYEAGHLCNSK